MGLLKRASLLLGIAAGVAAAFTIVPGPADPAGTEIMSLRTAESRHYANGDGTITSVIEASGPRARLDASASLQAAYTGYSELGYTYGSLQDSNRGVGGLLYCGYYDLFGVVTVLERGWVEWNISSIPDTATVTAVRCSTYCYSTTGAVTGLALYHMTNRPMTTPGVSPLYNDAGDGAVYRTRSSVVPGWLVDSLSGQAATDLRGRLAQDWFALGYTGSGTGTTWEVAFNGTGTTSGPPRLVVTWGSSSTADAGVTRILAPVGTIDSGQSVAPACSVTNYGTAPTPSFLVRCRIGGFHSDTARVNGLAPGASAPVTFPAYSAWPRGRFVVSCSTELAGDANPANNRRTDSVTVRVLDALPVAIVAPTGTVDSGATLVPKATVRNASSAPALVSVRLAIGSWSDSTAISLPPDSAQTVSFAQWTAAARGQYPVRCSTLLAGDLRPDNDTLSGGVAVSVTDAACAAILAPSGSIDPVPVVPRVSVSNLGTTRTAAVVALAINSSPAYSEQLDLPAGLPAGDTVLELPAWNAVPGNFTCRCSVAATGDQVSHNDTLSRGFTVRASVLPPGWVEVAQVPLAPSGRAVKDGGAVAHDAGADAFFVLKGNKTADFYRFYGNGWTTLEGIPAGLEGKLPGKGANICADGNGVVYATKGNNTAGFWKYSDSGWTQLADVPLGVSNKKIKGGTDLVYADAGDSQYVYLLKGYKTEFWRYDAVAGTWQALADAPAGVKPKWDKGSWLVDAGDGRFFAHKAKYHELYAFDLAAGTWGGQLGGIPLQNNQTGKRKKAKDGSDAALLDGVLYALKGGNTVEFYAFDPGTQAWAERETMPQVGSTARKKRVKGGGSITTDGTALYALKGNKTAELWRYVPGVAGETPSPKAQIPQKGVQEHRTLQTGDCKLQIVQNPAIGRATIRWAAPASLDLRPSTLSLYDAVGRQVYSRSIDNRHSSFDIALSPGVYLLRLSGGITAARKLVIE